MHHLFIYFLKFLWLNKDMENEENLYSKEFIERLNNQAFADNSNAKSAKIGFFITIGVAIALAVIALLVAVAFMSSQAQARINLLNDLNVASVQSHDLTKQYQDKINNVQIRVLNKNFFQSLLGLNNDISTYTSTNYTKKQQEALAAALNVQKDTLKETTERLHNAEISETLTRTYLQELSLLLNQILNDLNKAIDSKAYDANFTAKLTEHRTKLLEIKKGIQELETSSATQN